LSVDGALRGHDMEMAQIKYALAAAKSLNFTKAAHDCNVSQPALTKAVKALEEELGELLFHREGKRILLSEFGRSMLSRLRPLVEPSVTRSIGLATVMGRKYNSGVRAFMQAAQAYPWQA
jgi:DNA-binding MarR family transcriptional regulator